MTRPLPRVLALLVVACGTPEPPRYFSVDSEFTEPERETIRATVGAWCAEVGWCPEEVGWAERGRFELVDDLPEDEETARDCPPGRECVVSGNNDGARVRIARNRPLPNDLDRLWEIAAHEGGHYCVQGHLRDGLMAPISKGLEIDNGAARAWREGCAQ